MVHLDVDNLRHLSTIVLLFLVAVAVVIRVAVDDVKDFEVVALILVLDEVVADVAVVVVLFVVVDMYAVALIEPCHGIDGIKHHLDVATDVVVAVVDAVSMNEPFVVDVVVV